MRDKCKQEVHMVLLPMEAKKLDEHNEVQHPKLRSKELLTIFSQLADGHDDQRKSCTERMITLLTDKERSSKEGVSDDIKYSIKRLVQGLSSGRQVARLGYSVALCQLLRSLENIDHDLLFDCIKETARSYGSEGNSKMMIRNARIGKIFAYLVLVQSGKLLDATSDQISNVVQDLMKISCEKDYMPHLCYVAVSQIISRVKHKVFQKYVAPHLQENFTRGWSECSPDDLLLVLQARKHHPKMMEQHLTESWDGSKLISENTFQHIAHVFKKTRQHPVIHTVIDVVISEVIEQKLDLIAFWKTAVCPLFEDKTRATTRTVGLYIFDKLIPYLDSPKQVEEILFPHIANQLKHHNTQAVAKVMTLVQSTNQGQVQLSVLKCLVQHSDNPQYGMMNDIISHFVPDANTSLLTELKKAYTLQQSWVTEKKEIVPWSKWCVSSMDYLVTKGDDPAWQLDILQFLFIHSFFTVKKTSDIPHCKPCKDQHSDHVRAVTSQHFYKTITRLLSHNRKNQSRSAQFNQHLDVLYDLALYAQSLLQKRDCVQLQSQSFNKEVEEQWNKVIHFLPSLQEKRAVSENLGLSHAFQLMFIYGGLQLFSDSSAIEFLQELHVCYSRSTKRRKSRAGDEEPDWIEVITELLLSLMFKGSVLSRNIAKTAMATLAGHVTTGALHLVLDALQQKSVADEEGMVGVMEEDGKDEDSDDDEDDETKDDNDDDKESSSDEEDDDVDAKTKVDDDEEEDSGVEEEEGIEVSDDIKKKIKEALGDAAVDSDDTSEDEEEDLSDTEMFELDKKLAEAFQIMNRTRYKKLDKERKQQLLQFKIRSFDLLEVIVKNNPSVVLIKEMIVPLLDRMEGGYRVEKEQVLGNKAKNIFDQIYKTKKIVHDTPVDRDELLELFSDLMKLSRGVSSDAMLTDVVKGCVLVLRMLLNLQGDTQPSPVKTRSKRKEVPESASAKKQAVDEDKVIALVQSGLMDMFQQKSGYCTMSFFCSLLDKVNLMFWPMWEELVKTICSTDIKTHSRADAVIILSKLLNKQLVRDLDVEEWSSFVMEIKSLSEKVLNSTSSTNKHFIKELLKLFVKVYQVSAESSFKLLGDPEMKILEGMMPDFSQETLGFFRKLYRHIYKTNLPTKQHKRKNDVKKEGQSTPGKKMRLENQSITNGNSELVEGASMSDVEEIVIETLSPTETNHKGKKRKKKIKNADTTHESVADSPSHAVNTGKSSPKSCSSPQVTDSKKKRKKKRQSGLQDNMEVESEESSNKIVTETVDDTSLHDETVKSQSLNSINGSASSKKKKRKSGKFSTMS